MCTTSGHSVVEQALYYWCPHMEDVHLQLPPTFPTPISVFHSAPSCQALPWWQSSLRVLTHPAQNMPNLAAPRHPAYSNVSKLMVVQKSPIFILSSLHTAQCCFFVLLTQHSLMQTLLKGAPVSVSWGPQYPVLAINFLIVRIGFSNKSLLEIYAQYSLTPLAYTVTVIRRAQLTKITGNSHINHQFMAVNAK